MSTVDVVKSAGLELMELIRDRAMPPPPAALLLGLEIDAVFGGAITFAFPSDDRFSNGANAHGDIVARIAAGSGPDGVTSASVHRPYSIDSDDVGLVKHLVKRTTTNRSTRTRTHNHESAM